MAKISLGQNMMPTVDEENNHQSSDPLGVPSLKTAFLEKQLLLLELKKKLRELLCSLKVLKPLNAI